MAREIVSAMKASGYNFGIYSSSGEWSDIFGSYDVVLDNAYPLFNADYNDEQVSAPRGCKTETALTQIATQNLVMPVYYGG